MILSFYLIVFVCLFLDTNETKTDETDEGIYGFSHRSYVPGIPMVKLNVMTNIKIATEVEIKLTVQLHLVLKLIMFL